MLYELVQELPSSGNNHVAQQTTNTVPNQLQVRVNEIVSLSSLSTPESLLANKMTLPTTVKPVVDESQNWALVQPDTFLNHQRISRFVDLL